MGITKGKWGTLITELFEFKRLYDENAPLEEVFPDLTDTWPDRYGGMTLQELVAEMHAFKKDHADVRAAPAGVLAPAGTCRHLCGGIPKLVKNEVEQVPGRKSRQTGSWQRGSFPIPRASPSLPRVSGRDKERTGAPVPRHACRSLTNGSRASNTIPTGSRMSR